MPQSLSKVSIHIIFSTKNRKPLLNDSIAKETHSYIATVLHDLKSYVHIIGGTSDHIHIACTLPRTITQSELVNKVKSTSSKMLKTKGINNFYWQNGYGAFSVSQSNISKLIKYIENQQEHHKIKSFKEEYCEFLEKHRIDFNKEYLWD